MRGVRSYHPKIYEGQCIAIRPAVTLDVLDGQHQRVDIPARAKTAHDGLLQKRLEEDLAESTTQSVKGLS